MISIAIHESLDEDESHENIWEPNKIVEKLQESMHHATYLPTL
jgi:hypothetical protein